MAMARSALLCFILYYTILYCYLTVTVRQCRGIRRSWVSFTVSQLVCTTPALRCALHLHALSNALMQVRHIINPDIAILSKWNDVMCDSVTVTQLPTPIQRYTTWLQSGAQMWRIHRCFGQSNASTIRNSVRRWLYYYNHIQERKMKF